MKKAVTYTLVVVGIILIILLNYMINRSVHQYFNRPSLDSLEQRIQTLQLQADFTQTKCIEELDKMERVMERERNLFLQAQPTNGK